MNKQVKILISGGYGNGNIGDEALLIVMLEQIRHEFTTPSISIFSDNPSISKQYFKENFIYSGRFGLKDPDKKGIDKYSWIVKAIIELAKADIFITGGGTILQDKTHKLFVPFWFSKILLAQLFFKPTTFYGIGVGPLNRKSSKYLMDIVGRRMKLITVRGALSFEELNKFKLNKKRIFCCADPVILLNPVNKESVYKILRSERILLDENRLTIGISIREWYKFHSTSIKKKEWTKEGLENYRRFIIEFSGFIEYLIKNYDLNILFIPMSVFEPNDDRLAAKAVVADLEKKNINIKRIFMVDGSYSPKEIAGVISFSDFFIGMRFHSIIFSSALHIPSIGIAYGAKTSDFIKSIGLERMVINIDDFNSNRCIELFEELQNSKKVIISKLKKEMKGQRNKALENPRLLYDFYKNSWRV